MGRNQHSKDRMYITATEHAVEYGGFKKKREGKLEGSLPFACCALSLLPFETPCCSRDGVLFDSLALLPFVKEHGKSPVTGRNLRVKDVIRLKMSVEEAMRLVISLGVVTPERTDPPADPPPPTP